MTKPGVGTTYYSHCTECGRAFDGYYGQTHAEYCDHSEDRPNAVDEMEKRLEELKREFPGHKPKKNGWW
jgi:hypothetical protein